MKYFPNPGKTPYHDAKNNDFHLKGFGLLVLLACWVIVAGFPAWVGYVLWSEYGDVATELLRAFTEIFE